MKSRRGTMALALGLAVASFSSFGNESAVGWQNDCTTTAGWSANQEDKSFEAKVEQSEPSVIKVGQDGKDGWGKAAIAVKDINLDSTSVLQVKVNKVDKNSAYQIAVASPDWTEFFVVVPRSSADGIKVGDIKAATGWTGTKDFNIVLVVEGKDKATYIDDLRIVSQKQ